MWVPVVRDPGLFKAGAWGLAYGDETGYGIRVGNKLQPEFQRRTALEEIVHIILDMGGYEQESQNEPLVKHITNGIDSVLTDNDWVIGMWVDMDG